MLLKLYFILLIIHSTLSLRGFNDLQYEHGKEAYFGSMVYTFKKHDVLMQIHPLDRIRMYWSEVNSKYCYSRTFNGTNSSQGLTSHSIFNITNTSCQFLQRRFIIHHNFFSTKYVLDNRSFKNFPHIKSLLWITQPINTSNAILIYLTSHFNQCSRLKKVYCLHCFTLAYCVRSLVHMIGVEYIGLKRENNTMLACSSNNNYQKFNTNVNNICIEEIILLSIYFNNIEMAKKYIFSQLVLYNKIDIYRHIKNLM